MSASSFQPGSLERFNQFDVEAWRRWLEAWLVGIEAEPRIELYEGNLMEGLARLYRALPESPARMSLADAAAQLLNATTMDEKSASRLSTLIGLVSYACPSSGQAVIRRLLNMNRDRFVGELLTSVYLALLSAAGRYGLDTWLLNHLMAYRPIAPLQENLACFRILAQNLREKEAYDVLDRTIHQIRSQSGQSALRIELTYAVKLMGCVGLLRYIVDRQLEFGYDEEWAKSEDFFSSASMAALRRHLTPGDIEDLLRSFPDETANAVVSFLAELHVARLKDGSPLWNLDILDDEEFALVVRGIFHKMYAAEHEKLLRILQDAVNAAEAAENEEYEFDIDAINRQYAEFKQQLAAV